MPIGEFGAKVFGLETYASATLSSTGKLTVTQACMEMTSFTGTADDLEGIQLSSAFSAAMAGYIPFIIIRAASGHIITVKNSTGAQLSCGSDIALSGSKALVLWQAASGDNGFRDFNGVPELTGGFADISSAQSLSNKTLASPIITTQFSFDGLTNYAGAQQIWKQAGVNTTDATVTDLINIPLATSKKVLLEALIEGTKDDESAGIIAKVIVGARRAGGNITLIGTPTITVMEDAGTQDITVDVDTGTQALRVRVTGIAAENWEWIANYEYTIFTSAL